MISRTRAGIIPRAISTEISREKLQVSAGIAQLKCASVHLQAVTSEG